MIFKPISLILPVILEASDNHLPLTPTDMNRLLDIVPNGESMYLTIQDNLYTEWVLVENTCGTIVLKRGQGGSTPRRFPRGACVFFETSLPVIEWLICNYNCCEGADCECVPVEQDRAVIPTAIVGTPWEGRLLYKGTQPIRYDVSNMPTWMKAEYEGDVVRLSGTPDASGNVTVSVSAVNCWGEGLDTAMHTITVKENE